MAQTVTIESDCIFIVDRVVTLYSCSYHTMIIDRVLTPPFWSWQCPACGCIYAYMHYSNRHKPRVTLNYFQIVVINAETEPAHYWHALLPTQADASYTLERYACKIKYNRRMRPCPVIHSCRLNPLTWISLARSVHQCPVIVKGRKVDGIGHCSVLRWTHMSDGVRSKCVASHSWSSIRKWLDSLTTEQGN